METARLTYLCLALSFILTVVSTGQKSSELLFTFIYHSFDRSEKFSIYFNFGVLLQENWDVIPETEYEAPISISIIAWVTPTSAILKHYFK